MKAIGDSLGLTDNIQPISVPFCTENLIILFYLIKYSMSTSFFLEMRFKRRRTIKRRDGFF
jgi:hypothetical protein